MMTESGYVHRSEDVGYRVQLSLPPLLKAIVFFESCKKLHRFLLGTSAGQVEETSTMMDIYLSSSITTPTLLFIEPPAPVRLRGAKPSVKA
jgi:hypothetical protein